RTNAVEVLPGGVEAATDGALRARRTCFSLGTLRPGRPLRPDGAGRPAVTLVTLGPGPRGVTSEEETKRKNKKRTQHGFPFQVQGTAMWTKATEKGTCTEAGAGPTSNRVAPSVLTGHA